MSRVWIDIDLDDVDTSDLLEELQKRYLRADESAELLRQIKGDDPKLSLFLNEMERFTLPELQEMFKEDLTVKKVPKEQLEIFNPEPLST